MERHAEVVGGNGATAERRSRRHESPARATPIVWATWLFTVVAAAVWSAQYGRRYPYSDDWDIVEVIAGERAFSLKWLWSLEADIHRPIVPRLVISGLTALSNGDFVPTVWLDLILLAGTAALAILVMRRIRGHTALSDALFPLVLLSLVQPAFNWGYELNHVSVAVVAIFVLLVAARFGFDVPLGWLAGATALMPVLLGVGAPGLAVLPGLMAWLVLSAIRLRRTRRTPAHWILAANALVVAGFCVHLVWYPGSSAARPSPSQVATWALHLATGAAGPHADRFWPVTGAAAALGILATVGLLAVRCRQTPRGSQERDQVIALMCCGLAATSLVVAISVGRSANGWHAERAIAYSALFLPLVLWIHITWERLGRRLRPVAAVALLALAGGAYLLNVDYMPRLRDRQDQAESAFRRDLCRLEPRELARLHPRFLLESPSPPEVTRVAASIANLQRRGMGPFGCP